MRCSCFGKLLFRKIRLMQLGSDGASVMVIRQKGVGARLTPFIVSIHSVANKLLRMQHHLSHTVMDSSILKVIDNYS